MSAPSTNTVDAFSSMDALLGIGNQTVDLADIATFTDDDEKGIQNILNGSQPNNIDTSKDKPAEGQQAANNYPAFFESFKDILDQPFVLPEDDKTNYGALAVEKFGAGFGHINSRDAFFEETYVRSQKEDFLSQNNTYKALLDFEEGRFDKEQFLRNKVLNSLKEHAEATYSDFDDEKYQKILSTFFEGEGKGKMTAAGEAKYNELTKDFKGYLNTIRTQADQYAQQELETYRTNQAALASAVEKISIGGVQLGPELGNHILNFVRSGKLDAWEAEDKLTAEQLAERTVLKALVADPKSLTTLLGNLVKLSVDHGVSTVARNKF